MSNFNDQLSRMKDLINYGSVNEEAKPISTYSLEYKAQAADGKYYGIIRENSKYFVKVATPGKETIAEAYQYIGGVMNKTNYEYNSYTNALKQFELKLGSINEAYDENRKVNVEALDPYKKEDLVIEGTEKMKNELARQRQIMRNACVIMNEATEIGSTPFKTQPEAEHDNSGDKDYPYTKEGKPEEDRGAIKFGEGEPEKHSSTFGPDSNDVEDYDLDKGATPKVKDSVASENPKGGKVARVNESMEECGAACGMKECGSGLFDEEGDEGLELGHEDEPIDTEELDSVAPEELGGEEEVEPEMGDELGDGEAEFGEEDELGDDEDLDLDDEEELGDEEDLDDDEFDFEDEDDEFDDEDEFDDDEDLDLGDDEEFDEEGDEFEEEPEEGEFDDEEDPEIELDENVVKKFRQLVRESINEMWDPFLKKDTVLLYVSPESDVESEEKGGFEAYDRRTKKTLFVPKEMVLSHNPEECLRIDYKDYKRLLGDEETGSIDEWNGSDELEMMEKCPEYGSDEDDDYAEDDVEREDEDWKLSSISEAKAAKMNSIVESVVNDILNEDELHVFGDHPGYRKKPFTLPQTGEDKFQVNRDWNDESVHSEEPFGKGKGDSTPFDQLVAQITDSVMKQINENKKKVK